MRPLNAPRPPSLAITAPAAGATPAAQADDGATGPSRRLHVLPTSPDSPHALTSRSPSFELRPFGRLDLQHLTATARNQASRLRRAALPSADRRRKAAPAPELVPLFGAARVDAAMSIDPLASHDAGMASPMHRVTGVQSAPPAWNESGLRGLQALDRSNEASFPGTHDTERVTQLRAQLFASVAQDRHPALQEYLASNWKSLAPHFHALASPDGKTRQAAGTALAADDALSARLGIVGGDRVDRDDVSALIETLNVPDKSGAREAPLASAQYKRLRDALDDMPPGPVSALWQRFATGQPELASAGPSATFRLAALLLKTCGCDAVALESRLQDAELRLAPERHPAI